MDKDRTEQNAEATPTILQMFGRPISTEAIESAKAIFDMYDSYVRVGFTAEQAMRLTVAMLTASIANGTKK